MKPAGPAQRPSVSASLVMLLVAVLGAAGSYASSEYAAWKERERQRPRSVLGPLVKELRAAHKRSGQFPATLREVDEMAKTPRRREYTNEHRGAIIANYYYFYTRLDPHRASIWAVPVGPSSDEGTTTYVVLTPSELAEWQGPALAADEYRAIRPDPTVAELAALNLARQPRVEQQRRAAR